MPKQTNFSTNWIDQVSEIFFTKLLKKSFGSVIPNAKNSKQRLRFAAKPDHVAESSLKL